MTDIILPVETRPLTYGNIVKVWPLNISEPDYYLITQSSFKMMTLIKLSTKMEWNRNFEPIEVAWGHLTTETIKKYFPEWKDSKIEKVKYKFTFEIL